MIYIADLHIHSRYSRATSKELNLETLYQWAKIKGINVIGTGDFTHPEWLAEMMEKLVPDGTGLFRLKHPPTGEGMPEIKSSALDIRFCLSTEISSIYKYRVRVRKNHNLLFAPDFDTVHKINARLAAIGNLKSDGRPILGLPSRDLLEIVLESSTDAHLVPAHIWTPWFSTLGSKAGYDSIEECYRDLHKHIFALETGLSSDPEMNWRLSNLDQYALISNSDAHSPQKLGREANIFNTELSYYAMFEALKSHKGFMGTYEFFPEEGKYHLDGHRKCGIALEPEQTLNYKGICPACGKPLTVGVLHRVNKLADRKTFQQPSTSNGFKYIIPLPEIIAEIKGTGPGSNTVLKSYQDIISIFGNEFTVLWNAAIEDIEKKCGKLLAEAIRRVRERKVKPVAGYDGQFGVIYVFNEGELDTLAGQLHMFGDEGIIKMSERRTKTTRIKNSIKTVKNTEELLKNIVLNEEQKAVINNHDTCCLVKAGPGTGKTNTLTHWIMNLVKNNTVHPQEIVTVTFTNKAADELQVRLKKLLGEKAKKITIGTFHSICYQIIRAKQPELQTVYDTENRKTILELLFEHKKLPIHKLSDALERFFELNEEPDIENFEFYVKSYREYLTDNYAIDLSDIINRVLSLWQEDNAYLDDYRRKIKAIAIDEFQDINPLQYQFIKILGVNKRILAIGDPDQAIYGFRGSDVKLFFQFKEDFTAREISLYTNYRSTSTIVNASSDIIIHNSLKCGIKQESNKTGSSSIKLFKASHPQEEVNYILNEIDGYIGGTENLSIGKSNHRNNEFSFSDIAILFRTHSVGKEIMKLIKHKGIPAYYGDGSNFLSEPPFHIVGNILRLYINQKDLVSFDSILSSVFNWNKEDIKKYLVTLKNNSPGLWPQPADLLNSKALDDLKKWNDFYEILPVIAKENGVTGMLKAIFNRFLPDESLEYTQILKKETLLLLAKEMNNDVQLFLDRLLLNNYTDAGRTRAEGIHLLSFHAAKGLEFPVVFIAGAEEDITPLKRKNTDMEEERRLFYVALTRAAEEVHISWSENRILYNFNQAMSPSRFLSEINKEHLEKVELKQKRKQDKAEVQLSLF